MSIAQLDYADPPGLLALRQQIAEHVRRVRGASCSADQVVVVTGAQHGLSLMCQVLLDPGDTAWLEDPGYTGARAALTAAGARIAPIPVDGDGSRCRRWIRRAPCPPRLYAHAGASVSDGGADVPSTGGSRRWLRARRARA
jgi:GntR family transcriptional regulator/MocR family aminotransferase